MWQVRPLPRGTVQMHRLLTRISQGVASRADLDRLERLCDMVKYTSLCGLGQSAPNPVLSTLRYFRSEYEALIKEPSRDGDRVGLETDATVHPGTDLASGPSPPAPGTSRRVSQSTTRRVIHGGQDTHN